MTEKSYGGNNGVREHQGKNVGNSNKIRGAVKESKIKKNLAVDKESKDSSSNGFEGYSDYIKAGEILAKVREYAKNMIKPGMLLVEIARKIEEEIHKNGGECAFPVNLSIDEVAAHYHPLIDDTKVASGLLKVDIGIHINGYIADSAFSLDLTPDNKYKDLILASQEALDSALNLLDKNPSLNDIGDAIQSAIIKRKFSPVVNLSGHGLGRYNIHEGITIPNYANKSDYKFEPGAYAIEPFATIGEGKVIDGASSNIYAVIDYKNPRGPTARKILEYVGEKYKTLPFSLRELQEKFGPMARLAIKELEQARIVHNFPQLVEKSHQPVSQAEHSFIKLPDGKIIVTTR